MGADPHPQQRIWGLFEGQGTVPDADADGPESSDALEMQ
jgi:hypothetical protein